jgi:hypothetical protein
VKLKDLLTNNKTLIHLDISSNFISARDMKEIAVGLKKNTTLYGIHVLGNQAEIDANGFIEVPHNEVPNEEENMKAT